MKKTTIYSYGIRHVGEKDFADEVGSLPVQGILERMIRFSLEKPLATRMEFIIARTEDEIWQRFRAAQTRTTAVDGMDDITKLFAAVEGFDGLE